MSTRRLVVFEHESALGNAPAHALFERIRIARNNTSVPTRAYSDYDVVVDSTDLPSGITIHEML